jgi:SagB-type dehydrogenase family enzyme
MAQASEAIELSAPRLTNSHPLVRALQERRSVREFSKEALGVEEVSQLVWAAQGITHGDGFRTAPSAGALYPLELYIAVGNVAGIEPGVYKYHPSSHQLIPVVAEDRRRQLASAALEQSWIRDAAAVLVFAAVEARTTKKYGQRGVRYIHIEVGHAAQNVFLQAVALGLGAAVVGAFDDSSVARVMSLEKEEQALYLMPVGRKQE